MHAKLRADFHSEWITIGHHRLLIEVRDGFPGEYEHWLAHTAVKICERSKHARVVHIFHDDTHGVPTIRLASTNETDKRLANDLQDAIQTIEGHGNCQVEMEIVPAGRTVSDHYNHAAHLVGAVDKHFIRYMEDR